MCVIVIKQGGQARPPYKMLKACAVANPHGFGFCTPTKSYKSLDFDCFFNELQKVSRKEPCIIHFRYATHGSIKESNCHPFFDAFSGTWFAHNGVLGVLPDKDKTDSETAFLRYIAPSIQIYGYESRQVDNIVNKLIGSSKFAMLNNKKIRLFGNYFKFNNYLCSNLRFLPYLYERF